MAQRPMDRQLPAATKQPAVTSYSSLPAHWVDTGSGQPLQSSSAIEPSHRFPDMTFVIPNYQLGFILKSFALITPTAALGSQ